MRWILDLHQKYKGEEIWIAGSGPSLDTYPDDFLDDKLAITLHLAYLKFPNTTYREANEYDRVEWLAQNCPEYLTKKNIFGFPFYKTTEQKMAALIDLDDPNYYFFILHPYPPKDVNVIRRIIREVRGGLRIDFRAHGTALHDAVYAAIMMGCNPINVIGCELASTGNLEHFSLANAVDWRTTLFADKAHYPEAGTQLLMRACQLEGVEMNRIENYAGKIE